VKATEGVKNLEGSPEELPGVWGAERSEGSDRNWRSPRWPGGRCGEAPEGSCPITSMNWEVDRKLAGWRRRP